MSLGHGASIVRDGLVLHLDAANPKSYSGTGTSWKDLSGNGNNGTLINGVGYSSDNNGVMMFDGVNDYGYIEETTLIKPLNDFTVSLFCYPLNSSYSNVRVLGDWHQNANYDRWIFYANGAGITWYMRTETTGEGGVSGWPIVPNEWVNLVGVYTGSLQIFYVNGEYLSQRNCSGQMRASDGNRPIRFGQQGFYTGTSTAGNAFNGNISDIKLFNRALTPQEIKQNFNALRGRYGI